MDTQHAIMQREGNHASYSQAEYKIYHSCPHKKLQLSGWIAIWTSCSKDDQDNMQARENSTASQMLYTSESMHVRWTEQSWQNQNDYAKQCKMINQYNQHVNVLNKHDNEAQKNQNAQCAFKIWASTDRPIEYHVCFILSSSLTL